MKTNKEKASEYSDKVLTQALFMYDKDASKLLAENAYYAYLQGMKDAFDNPWRDVDELDSVTDGTRIIILTKQHKIVLATKASNEIFGVCAFVGRGYLRSILAWFPIPEFPTIKINE